MRRVRPTIRTTAMQTAAHSASGRGCKTLVHYMADRWPPSRRSSSRTSSNHMWPLVSCRAIHLLPADTAAAYAAAARVLFVPPVCFSSECQAKADAAMLVAVVLPVAAAAAAAWLLLRPPAAEAHTFEDEATGAVFEMEPGESEPERDKNGQLAFRAFSYTPWPVPADAEGERLRIKVGPVADRRPRTYVFDKVLPQPSELLVVSLPRPMGVVFEYDQRSKRACVVGVVEGSAAEQRRRVAGINPGLASTSVQDGDVLRGVTATNFVYPTKALFGAVPPQRHVVLYGADKQPWGSIRGALRKGEARDGPVTLVLERRRAAS